MQCSERACGGARALPRSKRTPCAAAALLHHRLGGSTAGAGGLTSTPTLPRVPPPPRRQPSHPIGIIKGAIYDFFESRSPGAFRTFDNLHPVVPATAVSAPLLPSSRVACRRWRRALPRRVLPC